jgi:PAS domain-containing protein
MTPGSPDPSAPDPAPDRTEQERREDESRYRRLFEDFPVSLWEMDYSAAKRRIDRLRAGGVRDLRAHFRDHPDEAAALLSSARMVAANAATVRLHKASSKEELMACRIGPFCPDSYDAMLEARIALAEGQTTFDSQMPTTTVNGENFRVIVRWSILRGYEATWERVLVSVTDITELTKAAESLTVSEKRYRDLFENSPVSLWELDYSAVKRRIDRLRAAGVQDLRAYCRDHPEEASALMSSTRILAVNAATVRLHGSSSKEELLARRDGPFAPDAQEALIEARTALAEGQASYEVRAPATNANGQKLQVILRWSILPGCEATWERVLVSVTDITDLTKAVESLTASEKRYRDLFENSSVSLWEMDYSAAKRQIDRLRAGGVRDLRAHFRDHPDEGAALLSSMRIVTANAATVRLHKASSKEELMACRIGPFSSDSYDAMLEARIALAEGRTTFDSQVPDTTVNGEKLQVIVRWSILPGCEATWERVLVSVTDITDLTKAVESLAAGEKRYRSLFENSPVAMWEADFSEVRRRLDQLQAAHAADLEQYLRDHPQEVRSLVSGIRALNPNEAMVRLNKASSKEELLSRFPELFTESALAAGRDPKGSGIVLL